MRRTVVAIPPSYDEEQELELESTNRYLNYLYENKIETVMTTAGTSHFNLLDIEEIHRLNRAVVEGFQANKIIGIPAISKRHAIKFIKQANEYIDSNTSLMALYPERFYSESVIIDYMASLREATDNKIYIHGKTIRNATGGTWDYSSNILNTLYDLEVLQGIKEEHSNLYKSYDFVSNLNKGLDVIVAGGSMRRFEFLETAGANSFLAGIGNLFPSIEIEYLQGKRDNALFLEKKLFDVFMKFGWHKSLRIGLDVLGLTCYNNREPWPKTSRQEREEVENVLQEIRNEK